jgi:hypothetical protein
MGKCARGFLTSAQRRQAPRPPANTTSRINPISVTSQSKPGWIETRINRHEAAERCGSGNSAKSLHAPVLGIIGCRKRGPRFHARSSDLDLIAAAIDECRVDYVSAVLNIAHAKRRSDGMTEHTGRDPADEPHLTSCKPD